MAPAPSPSGPDGDPLSSSLMSSDSSRLPLFSTPFSLPPATFTSQGTSFRPSSSGFSFGGASRFPLPIGSYSAVLPQPGFTVRGPCANALAPSTLTNPVSGQNPRIFMRPLSVTAVQVSASGVQSAQVQLVQGGGPTLHIPGTVPTLPPSQLQAITVSPQIGAGRPGVLLPTSTFLHPRPAAISPPEGMGPRFPAPPFTPPVRPPTFGPRPVPHVSPPGTALPSCTLLSKFPVGQPGADLSKVMGPCLLLEKPHTLVYVGKISSTVDEEFLRSILQLCGPVKSWKRAQEPTTGTPKGFGFCEFELPQGVLRALRLLNGFSLDGQELKITVNATTREYLEHFVQKKQKKEHRSQLDARQTPEAEVETAPGVEAPEPPTELITEAHTGDSSVESHEADPRSFGIVTEEDKQKDDEALKKLVSLLAQRASAPPLPSASDATDRSKSRSDTLVKARDGDSMVDEGKNGGQEGNSEREFSEIKVHSEPDRLDMGLWEQGRHLDFERDRDRNLEKEWDREMYRARDRGNKDRDREKERERLHKKDKEYEQAERERERIRVRRERDQVERIRDAERQFEDREKEWEKIEKEKERRRNVDKEKEKERERHRKNLIFDQGEHEDEAWKKAKRRAEFDERKRRQREREDDEMDRVKEEEEIVEAKQRKLKEEYEEQVKKKIAEIKAAQAASELEDGSIVPEATGGFESEGQISGQMADGGGNEILENIPSVVEIDDDAAGTPGSMESDEKQVASPPRRLGFGLLGSGKRALVPSLFNEENEDELANNRGFRELVPIEYSAEEMQAVSSLKVNTYVDMAVTSLAAAAEFAKSLSNMRNDSVNGKSNGERDRALQQTEKSKSRCEDWSKDRNSSSRTDVRSGDTDIDRHMHRVSNPKVGHTSAQLDTKQLIDMIPKKKDELFAYRIDWKVYDQYELHERMKPWIEKKILEFLGEEEPTLVDYIVSNTRKHTSAAQMLDLLATILDDEAELFVMKLWRMLIFEVKKIETGLSMPKPL